MDRWSSLTPWVRFTIWSVLALTVSAFLPAWRLPGPEAVTERTTTTSEPSTTFPFSADQFLEGWNTLNLSDDQLDLVFDVPGLESDRTGFPTFTIAVPEVGANWTVTIATDPKSGLAQSVTLVSPLDADTDASSFGSIMVIAVVEETSFDEALKIWNGLLEGLDEDITGEDVSLTTSTDAATYQLVLATTTHFLFRAEPSG